MAYHVDFALLTLQDLQRRLMSADLIPSQLPLLDNIDRRMLALEKTGIRTLQELSAALKGSKGPTALADASGVPMDYLLLLRRTIEGFRPKPIPLSEYPGVKASAVRVLADAGIKDSAGLYAVALGRKARNTLAEKTGVPVETIDELAMLANLSRIQWVGSTFARVLLAAGYRGPAQIAAADPEAVYAAVTAANADKRFYGGTIGLRDMRRLVNLAAGLDDEMEA